MQKVIVIVGATGTKKTQLALQLALKHQAEIINADAFQVYQEINVGVNKPTATELALVPHHLISSYSIYDTFDLKIYQSACYQIMSDIFKRGKNVILCGGSNLYIDAVIKGFNLDKSLGREELTYFNDWSYDQIYAYVLEHDPEAAHKITVHNQKRIIRAAQIIHSTNQTKTSIEQEAHRFIYDCFIIETYTEREQLYTQLNARVIKMFNEGWTDEVKNLLKRSDCQHLKAMEAIGYKQIMHALLANQEPSIELIQQSTRQLAKKQMTWNRNKYPKVYQFKVGVDDFDTLNQAVESFLKA